MTTDVPGLKKTEPREKAPGYSEGYGHGLAEALELVEAWRERFRRFGETDDNPDQYADGRTSEVLKAITRILERKLWVCR